MRPYLEDAGFGNAASVHRRGEAARDAIERARAQVAELASAMPEEVVFTASGSEANNLALKGIMLGAAAGRRRIVVSAVEHLSVLETARHLEARGFPLTIVPVGRDGALDPERLAAALADDVALVSVQWVNNEVGTIQPVAEVGQRAHACGARFHCDAVQAAGKLAIDFGDLGADLMSLAGHKLAGPLGAAALVVRGRVRLVPLVHGGHQERGRRAGTENLPAIVGFGVAAARAGARIGDGAPARIAALGERLAAGLLAAVPGARLNGLGALRAGSIVNVCFPGADGEAVLHELDREGITVSTGSACSAATPGPSHVLTAMGLGPEEAHASVRFSLGEGNDEEDVDRILRAVPVVLRRLRVLAGEPAAPDAPRSTSGTARA
jgi:cysteine desulfurase